MGLKRTDEFRQDAVRIALTSGLKGCCGLIYFAVANSYKSVL